MCALPYAELEIAVGNGHFLTNFHHLAKQIWPNLLYVPMGRPLIVNNVSAFMEWPTNFKSIFQALLMPYVGNFW